MIKKVLIIFTFFGFLLLYTWQQVQILRVGYDITDKEKIMKDLDHQNRELMIACLRLKSPRRIEIIAREKIGLVTSKRAKIIYINNVVDKKEDLRVAGVQGVSLKEDEELMTKSFLGRLIESILKKADAQIVTR